MAKKSFRYFKKTGSAGTDTQTNKAGGKPLYKYSVYMQSRDSTWLNRNLNKADEYQEPIEEDIRD